MNILYINLDKDILRNINMTKQFFNLNWDLDKIYRIDGVDGKRLTDEEKEYYESRKNFRTMCNIKERIHARVGCMLSHLKAIKHAIDNNYKNVIILEDDITINYLPNLEDIPENLDILYLGVQIEDIKEEEERQTGKYIHIKKDYMKVYTTCGYYIPSREKLLDIYTTLTSQTRMGSIDNDFVREIQSKGNCYIINPISVVQNDNIESNIGYSKKFKLKREY